MPAGSAAEYAEALERLRAICLALPEATEKLSHGSPCFFVGRQFLALVNDHHGDGRFAIWCKGAPGEQEMLRAESPPWFFVPPYVGPRGWLGIELNRGLGWDEIAEYCVDAYRAVAPPRLAAQVGPAS